ncbi:MAG: tellurite resistance/C4-dicarboxylate transporter family protein [Deltaproteobacteria bacterium]|nr:tellurite resistance/C4-dicarboxylate transporter family protein [Deltaproteobacteria bacterium]
MEVGELGGDTGGPARLSQHVRDRLQTFHPAYFALPMATGVVSVAGHLLGLAEASELLYWISLVAYGVLWAITITRACRFSKSFLADWTSHQRGPGFFTTVSATCVVGTEIALRQGPATAQVFWWIGLGSWAVCTYTVFVALAVRESKPTLADGIHGGWLLAVVATQSVCVLGCRVLPATSGDRDLVLLLLASLWLCGGMLYVWMIALIFYRYMFFRFEPTDLMPPYWINMGAVAISTLAGTALVEAGVGSPVLGPLLPFLKGLTLMFWATATWWIPMLVILGVWRHRVRGLRFAYDPLYWGLVFPLGMYSVCTFRLSGMLGAPALQWIAKGFVIVALAAWLLTFFGMTTRLLFILLLALRGLSRSARPVAVPGTRPQTLRGSR